MRLIDRLVLKDLINPFLSGLAMFMLLVFAVGYMFHATDLLVKGVPLGIVTRLTLFSLPEVVTQTFPMAMLLAGLLGFGRLSADREVVAIYAAGISFPRAVRACVVFGALISLGAFLWNDYVVPPAKRAYWDIQQQALEHIAKSDTPLSYAIENKETKGVEKYVTIDGGYDAKTRTLRRVTIVQYKHGSPEVIVYCARAIPNDQTGLNWTYFDGYVMPLVPEKTSGKIENLMPVYFDEIKSSPRTPSLEKTFEQALNSDNNDPNRKSFRALQREIKEESAQGKDVRGKEVDLYGKIAMPLAALIFGVVGAALGLNTQRGGGKTVGFGLAVFIVFLYYVFYHSMFVVGKSGGMSPMLASFLPDIVGAIVGLVLSIRASR
jgi:lipopolysaccharide export system permease protein